MGHKHSKSEVLGEAYKSQAKVDKGQAYKGQAIDHTGEESSESGEVHVLTRIKLAKFSIKYSPTFAVWVDGKTFNGILFDWKTEKSKVLLTGNTWERAASQSYNCRVEDLSRWTVAFFEAAKLFVRGHHQVEPCRLTLDHQKTKFIDSNNQVFSLSQNYYE